MHQSSDSRPQGHVPASGPSREGGAESKAAPECKIPRRLQRRARDTHAKKKYAEAIGGGELAGLDRQQQRVREAGAAAAGLFS